MLVGLSTTYQEQEGLLQTILDVGRALVSELDTEAVVPGIDDAAFQKEAQAAKAGCPVSQALAD